MSIHILTLSAVYPMMAVSTLILGSFHLATLCHGQTIHSPLSLMRSHALLKSGLVVLTVLLMPVKMLFHSTALIYQGIFLSIIVGFVYYRAECSALKWIARQQRRFNLRVSDEPAGVFTTLPPLQGLVERARYCFPFVITALAEEWLFRGVMTVVCGLIFTPMYFYLPLFCVNLLFACSHLQLGKWHVISKFILGAISFALFIVFQNLLPSMIFHAVFNVLVVLHLVRMNHA